MATQNDLYNVIETAFFHPENLPKLVMGIAESMEKPGKASPFAASLRNLLRRRPNTAFFLSHPKVMGSQDPNFCRKFDEIEKFLVPLLDSSLDFSSLVFNNELISDVATIISGWENKEELSSHHLEPISKILFSGPPGTGKTSLAHALAKKLDLPILAVQCPTLYSSFLGESMKNIQKIFDVASFVPCILFLDEIDSITSERATKNDVAESGRVTTSVLTRIENFPHIIIGATNHEHILDIAAKRRFDMVLSFKNPTTEQIQQYLTLLAEKYRIHIETSSEDIQNFNEKPINYAELKYLVQNLARKSILKKRIAIESGLFVKASDQGKFVVK